MIDDCPEPRVAAMIGIWIKDAVKPLSVESPQCLMCDMQWSIINIRQEEPGMFYCLVMEDETDEGPNYFIGCVCRKCTKFNGNDKVTAACHAYMKKMLLDVKEINTGTDTRQ
jgi:hypothetical protein